jgi:aryl-alcohol dehydrogenase-like predicted oxidoreductase
VSSPAAHTGGGTPTGKYARGNRPEAVRLVANDMCAWRYGQAASYQTAEGIAEHAAACGLHPVTLVVAWVMSHWAVTVPIVGTSTIEQRQPSLDAAGVAMTTEWRAEISPLSVEQPPATHRSEDRVVRN